MGWIDRFDNSRAPELDFRVLTPAAPLRPFVRYYWILKSHGPLRFTNDYLAPDGFEELIFSFAGHYRRSEIHADSRRDELLHGSYAVGCKSVGVHCLRLADIAMVGVKFWPNALHSLLGVRLDDMRNRPVPLRELNLAKLREIETRLYEARDEAAIKRLLDEMLTPADLASHASPLVDYSVRRIFEARGDISIDSLLRDAGTHYRTAERAFQQRVGVSPKQLARVVRFKHAFTALSRRLPRARPPLCPTDFGYYDASHFTKDFRRFTGQSPAAFFRDHGALSTEIFRFCLDVDLCRLDAGSPAQAWSL